ncbi:MAG: hypothetical protein A2X77_01860 [Gammaproteobacteria bacterium GWE2_42_36]|nr:MAG: hypothetical protein A2X77_01860 [Gammaproteobacteria bacterium GWE2_42_36]HCU05207.1 hypothetical protein [Coxiellaceae bacterium]
MIKIMIVDDHRLVRKGISSLLANASDISVVGEAESGEEAIQAAKEHRPHVILMDLQMQGIGGLEATKKLLRIFPHLKILVVTVCENDIFPSRLLDAGASGYITKNASAEEIVLAIREVYQGKCYICTSIAQKLAVHRYSRTVKKTVLDTLSSRELQILVTIAQGKKTPIIAKTLHLSPKTINTYRYRLFEKLGVKNDVELTHIALQNNLLEAE